MTRRRTLALLVTALTIMATSATTAATTSRERKPLPDTEARTRAFLHALQSKNFPAAAATIDRAATLAVALSFSGAQAPQARFTGKEQVLGYLTGVFDNMATIRFTDVQVSMANRGETSFVQANGDFTTVDGRPYRNVYVFRYDWRGGRIVHTEEYGNPVTFCKTFGAPDC